MKKETLEQGEKNSRRRRSLEQTQFSLVLFGHGTHSSSRLTPPSVRNKTPAGSPPEVRRLASLRVAFLLHIPFVNIVPTLIRKPDSPRTRPRQNANEIKDGTPKKQKQCNCKHSCCLKLYFGTTGVIGIIVVMASTSLPPRFRFHPTDEELILYYLKRKLMDQSCLKSKDLTWYFFCPREKYPSGSRVKRAAEKGYWKTSGKDRAVHHKDKKVGTIKSLVFHLGHAPKGERTNWVLHEYQILNEQLAAAGIQDTYVLCKIFQKNGPGPKHGAQYGAPFNESDWSDDDMDDFALGGPSTTQYLIEDQMCPPVTSSFPSQLTNEDLVELLTPLTDDDMLIFNEYGQQLEMNDTSESHELLSPLSCLESSENVQSSTNEIFEDILASSPCGE
ncbi:NAC domain containing protein 103 [Striga hermonthica]|uniref:NAC domain containing protein 103 n=1 Tax=Striga hermonthica TaxID=68872 RepID=A0A9N7MYM0_STRHE|nr:NAC domain containing protein 103 [Striga hermonthica]